MSQNPLIIVDKLMLNRCPELKGKLNALCKQMYEEEEVYTYLPKLGYGPVFLQLLQERNIRYGFPSSKDSTGNPLE